MAATPDVGQRRDRVAGRDHLADRRGRPRWRLHHAAGVDRDPADLRVDLRAGLRRLGGRPRLDLRKPVAQAAQLSVDPGELRADVGASLQLADLFAQQRALKRRHLVALGEDVVGQRPVALFQVAEANRLGEHVAAGRPGVADDLRVLATDPLGEVDLLEQVRETVRGEDHRDEVGCPLLVLGPEVRGEVG